MIFYVKPRGAQAPSLSLDPSTIRPCVSPERFVWLVKSELAGPFSDDGTFDSMAKGPYEGAKLFGSLQVHVLPPRVCRLRAERETSIARMLAAPLVLACYGECPYVKDAASAIRHECAQSTR